MAQQINLFNPAFRRQRKHFSAVTLLQALGLLLGGIVAFYGYTIHETRALAQVADDTGKQLKVQAAQVVRLTQEFSPQGRSRMLEEELARAATRLKQREEMLATLRTGGLGNTEGFARYLTAFARQALYGVWLTGFSIGGDESVLLLNGRVLHAELVPAYIRALNREEVMRGRRVTELRMTAREEHATAGAVAPATPPRRYVEFNLTALRGPVVPGTTADPGPKAGVTKPATSGTSASTARGSGETTSLRPSSGKYYSDGEVKRVFLICWVAIMSQEERHKPVGALCEEFMELHQVGKEQEASGAMQKVLELARASGMLDEKAAK